MTTNTVRVTPGTLVVYERLGIQVYAAFSDDPELNEQPYVTIDTSELPPAFTYDEATGLRGDAEPYSTRDAGESWEVVRTAKVGMKHVASFPGDVDGRLDAVSYAKLRNSEWHKECGMPTISVHLNDGAAIYDDEGQGNTAHLTDQVVEQLKRMAAAAEKARDEDDARWQDVTQDTEEAEQSGALAGYAEALQAVLRYLEPSTEVVG